MKQEEKQLLLKDLCARLQYGVYVLIHDTFEYSPMPCENVYLKSSDISSLIDSISLNERYNSKDKRFNRIIREHKDFLEFKPYLRPISSMTQEEIDEYDAELDKDMDIVIDGALDKDRHITSDGKHNFSKNFVAHFGNDWLNKKGFDYRGLIPMGLALEAPEGMYKTE